jgi:hypothetical protein
VRYKINPLFNNFTPHPEIITDSPASTNGRILPN